LTTILKERGRNLFSLWPDVTGNRINDLPQARISILTTLKEISAAAERLDGQWLAWCQYVIEVFMFTGGTVFHWAGKNTVFLPIRPIFPVFWRC